MKFELNKKEKDKLTEIKLALELLFNEYKIEYRFVLTSIGICVKIYCPQIDKEFDVTDYESW